MKRTSGFTIVEMSIVITIIAILTAAVIEARSLIESAKLRTTMEEIGTYSAAFKQFKDKFGMYPGDFNEATSLWGAASTVSNAVCYTTAGTGTQTCNGDGNGQVGAYASNWYEGWRAWQHLVNAKMAVGDFTGMNSSRGTRYGDPDVNIPRATGGKEAGYGFNWYGTQNGAGNMFAGTYRNVLLLGRGSDMDDVVLKAEDAMDIDNKMDDGKPGMGLVRTPNTNLQANCATSSTAATAAYNIANGNADACSLSVLIQN